MGDEIQSEDLQLVELNQEELKSLDERPCDTGK